ncbi:G-protein coupled receptor 183 [Nerophis lumbriciformis]|uniref:G-protein coupled receptor 183 n=1 Tax=Nerophis lumbriciformis TaxID=546530 RepID=UPI002AE03E31|nr:G-protein coupled receptor 183-like [Nerophis lumbriciformis]
MAANNTTLDSTSCDVFVDQKGTVILVPVFYSLVFLISLCGNALVLLVICQKREKFNSTAVYLLNLALSDILFTLALPSRIIYYILDFHWPFGDFLCRMSAVLFFANTYAGIGFMTCISLDRYLAVVHPQRMLRLRQVKLVRWICCLVWAVVLVQVAPLLFYSKLQHHGDRWTCMEYIDVDNSQWKPHFLLLGCVVSFCCPLVAILVSYARIHAKLRVAAGRNSTSPSKRNHRADAIILLILLTFIACFSPYHLNVMQFLCRRMHHEVSCEELRAFRVYSQITVLLMNFNCCLDPVLYFFAIRTYKKRVMNLFRERLCVSTPTITTLALAKTTTDNSSSDS